MTQIIGIKPEAVEYLYANVKRKPQEICEKCHHIIGGEMCSSVYDDKSGKSCGMFDDGPDLNEYILKDGNIIREIVQSTPWSSGPCIFLCLEDKEKNRLFEWSDEEINNLT